MKANGIKKKSFIGLFFLLSITGLFILGSMNVSAVVPYINEKIDFDYSGNVSANGIEGMRPQISQDGRYVAFSTRINSIVPGDTNGKIDVFVRDRKLGTTVRATLSNAGGQLLQDSIGFSLSENGRYLAFSTIDSTVVSGDTNNNIDSFVRDLQNNTTEIVSVSSAGVQGNNTSSIGDITADGRYVVFSSSASNLVSGDTNAKRDIFVRDRKLNTTSLLSKNSAGNSGNNESSTPSISCDGTYVSFYSAASDLVVGDTNGYYDLFLVDRINSNSITNITAGANDHTTSAENQISCNGSTVIFMSTASNLVPNDTNGRYDIFAYDIWTGVKQRVNVDSSENQSADSVSPSNTYSGGVDFSGRYVVFEGAWNDLVTGDTNGTFDIFMRDLQEGTTQIVSKRNSTTQSTLASSFPSITLDGREVIFLSTDTGLVAGDTNGLRDIFVSKTGI